MDKRDERVYGRVDETHLWGSLQLVHLVAAKHRLHETFYCGIELHECHVAAVEQQQADTLRQHDLVIQKEIDEHEQADDVERDVSEQRPPGEVQHLFGEQSAHPDHKQDVEYGRAHDGSDAYVAVWDEDSNDRSEELRSGATCRHEGGPGDVVWDLQLLCDDSERGNKEFIADDS